jgi:pilus assembly protein CpaB
MERRRVIMMGITIAIAAWLVADLLLPMTGLTGGSVDQGTLVGIAARNLPAGRRVTVEDVEPIPTSTNPNDEKGPGKADAAPAIPAAVGRVLARSIAVGENNHSKDLVPRSTGEIIARQLAPGYRAVTVTLRDSTATVALYPGALVDVLSTMDVPVGTGNQHETTTRTMVERAKVLAVNSETTVRVPQEPQSEERRTTPRRPTVTLALTPEQAAQVELAGAKGTISVTVRAELDTGTSVDANAALRRPPAEPKPAPPAAVVSTKPAAPPPAPAKPAKPETWDVIIQRGTETERVPFRTAPAPDAGTKPKTP